VALAVSFAVDRAKTLKALAVGWKRFRRVLPMLVVLVMLTALVLGFISQEMIIAALSGAGFQAKAVGAAMLGSVTAIPGFVAFPLAGILVEQGVSYTVIASFTTTLMMVGFVSFPLERSFLGARVALVRNMAGFVIALAVAFAVGLAFGEFAA